MLTAISPAKINLYLRITGKRIDGYHLIDSLFAFTEFGDHINIHLNDSDSDITLAIDGPFATALSTCPTTNNLAYRAAQLLKKQYNVLFGAHIHLTKNLPVSAGIGGGSSNAATVLKLLNRLWQLDLDNDTLARHALTLGADVPACLYSQPLHVKGIGEQIKIIQQPYQRLPILLVNPNKPLSTPAVFSALTMPINTGANTICSSDNTLPAIINQSNDLELPACQLLTEITTLLHTLKQFPILLARMSGSGPTCFALFNTDADAEIAQDIIKNQHPTYWSLNTHIHIPRLWPFL